MEYVLKNAQPNADSVIDKIDQYCKNEHWMMNVGDEKGYHLEQAVKECKPTTVLELGTYCGKNIINYTLKLIMGVNMLPL